MPWNWELDDWPHFKYHPKRISCFEREFLLGEGSLFAYLKTIDEQDYKLFIVEILSLEGVESSRIEGEILERESLQSSIRKHFGLQIKHKKESNRESQMAELLCNVYTSHDKPLTHEMLWQWHSILFKGESYIDDCGRYRTHREPMQIVSSRYDSKRVFFEAPPSKKVAKEMEAFVNWYNSTDVTESILGRAAIAHVYFESIHPFEDGNGRIGRVLAEKILAQGVGKPVLLAISLIFEKRKKEYYAALEKCNRTLDVHHWVEFFASVVLQSQKESMALLHFLIEKSKMLIALSPILNSRQMKALLKMFSLGPQGFEGGLSAENYISITKCSRATATRDLTGLVKKGALVKSGELRHTRYRLNIALV